MSLPTIQPPQGVLLCFSSHSPLSTASGLADIQVTLAGTTIEGGLQLYVDDSPIGEAMKPLHRNRYIQTVDSARYLDGLHRLGVAALDAKSKVRFSASTDLFFRNLQSMVLRDLHVPSDGLGFRAEVRLAAPRHEIPARYFSATDRCDGVQEELQVKVAYNGETHNGIPMCSIFLSRPKGEATAPGTHRIGLTLRDNLDTPVLFAHETFHHHLAR